MTDHDATDIDTLAGLYECVRDLVAERDAWFGALDEIADVLLGEVAPDGPATVELVDLVRGVVAERDRLRAVADAALPVLRQVTDSLRDDDGGPLNAHEIADATTQVYRSIAETAGPPVRHYRPFSELSAKLRDAVDQQTP